MKAKKNRFAISILLCSLFLESQASFTPHELEQSPLTEKNINTIRLFINNAWRSLRRNTLDCQSLTDAKTKLPVSLILYLPNNAPLPAGWQTSTSETQPNMNSHKICSLKRLPKTIVQLGDVNGNTLAPGLLYLPHPYIVPGGVFNEMYGWDSYFIILGLIESQRLEMAFNMIENFFYEIEYYGAVLNGNRTYYLSRSQPPFLTSMIRSFYQADSKREFTNVNWLRKAYKMALKDYRFWTTSPHLIEKINLSRYYDFGAGPVPEVIDSARTYYKDINQYFLGQSEHIKKQYLLPKSGQLTPGFYLSDRAMRESGFDTSFRFGPFSASTIDYAAVDLNSLLYKAEIDLAWMSQKLGLGAAQAQWLAHAQARKARMKKYFWHEEQGLFFDYNFVTKKKSTYQYATTFYPLWAGLASKAQAKKIVAQLQLFERAGGLATSPYKTGVQWDAPYGWPPIQLIAALGLKKYGYKKEATRLAKNFLALVMANFLYDNTIREKYDVEAKSAEMHIQVGYKENMIGFGWTNGVFLVLLREFIQTTASNAEK